MMILNSPGIHKIIQALCWTLVHSLWQGLVLAIVGGVVLLLTRKSKPVLRYNLLTIVLLLFVTVTLGTFWNEMVTANPTSTIIGGGAGISSLLAITSEMERSLVEPNVLDAFAAEKITDFLNYNAAVVVSIWFIIFSIKSLKAASGLAYVSRIRNYGTHVVEAQWQWDLRQLAQKIGIYERIELVASEIVKVPLVTGFFRPMIVVPLGFLTSLPIDQVEAILLHELAHVKRRDYLVNLLQTAAGTLFFFNPAVLWISSLIREEREHCCDDLAIEVLGDKSSFINALVSFQEYNLHQSHQAVAFAGKRNHLLDRIKRIIYNNNKQLNAMEKLFVTASFIIAAGLSVAFSPASEPLKKPSKEIEVKLTESGNVFQEKPAYGKLEGAASKNDLLEQKGLIPLDTLPAYELPSVNTNTGISNMSFTRDGKKYNVVADGEEIIYLKINGKAIPKEEIGQFKPEIEQMLAEVKKAHADAEQARNDAEVMRAKAEEARAQAGIMRKQADEMRETANENRNQSRNMNIDAEKFRKNAEEIGMAAEQMRKQTEGVRKQAEEMRVDADKHRIEAEKYRVQADELRKGAEVQRKQAERMRVEYEKMQEELIGELIRAGVIENVDNLSYKLSGEELIVNGKKQSDSLHQKLKARFLKTADVEMVYNWRGKTGHTTTGIIYGR